MHGMGGENRPRVVIVGGGFGGLNAAKALARAPVDVTLVDRTNHHLFQPLLYQVATAGLSPADIAEPIRRVLRKQKNATVLLAEVVSVDPTRRAVVLTDGEIEYDHLILACGAAHSWFGHDEWAQHAMGLKTLEDALEIRRRVLLAYEQAERSDDPAEREALLTFVVVGGGATGVELAGALAEIARQTLAKDFRRIDPRSAKIHLLEAGPRVLPVFSADLSEKALRSLERIGVLVRLSTPVTKIASGEVHTDTGILRARTILWAAGVQASPVAKSLGAPLDRAGRVRVEPDYTVPDHPEIYVIGDMATLVDASGVPVPGVCQGGIQSGKLTAANIVRTLRGEPRKPMRYRNLGITATIGLAHAVVELPRFKFSGFFAWLFWAFLHIALLIGFDNRLVVMIEWMWAWFTFDRGARLISHGETAKLPPHDG
jgi:NADH:ubiquinone reductase (H+-translocating)